MARLVAFLRAINVGGRTVKMDHLRSLISGYGMEAVETFIASGNVIVEGGRRKPANVESMLERRLEADLGYPVATFVRTTAELAHVVDAEPFFAAPGRYYVTFLKEVPVATATERLLTLRSAAEDFAVVGRDLHWLVRTGFETRLTGNQSAWAAFGPGTTRNITTIRRLAAKYPPPSTR
ncbi:MAG: DUF1697 domain-containing protein [Actinomycetota bacterium]|nr:DUF1697 domain-containing protein [Geodermatophilaceae bacterium]MDQ3055146.1 DUF1697 domain-containing protein [Actinomycetota bacterium]